MELLVGTIYAAAFRIIISIEILDDKRWRRVGCSLFANTISSAFAWELLTLNSNSTGNGVLGAKVVEGPFPGSYDVAVLRNIIQVLSANHAQKALSHVYQCLEPGGTIFILGTILDDSRLTPSYAVKSNLSYLNIYDEGRAYTEGGYRDWVKAAGFVGFERVVVQDGTSIIKAQNREHTD